jgi:hypothetical protein
VLFMGRHLDAKAACGALERNAPMEDFAMIIGYHVRRGQGANRRLRSLAACFPPSVQAANPYSCGTSAPELCKRTSSLDRSRLQQPTVRMVTWWTKEFHFYQFWKCRRRRTTTEGMEYVLYTSSVIHICYATQVVLGRSKRWTGCRRALRQEVESRSHAQFGNGIALPKASMLHGCPTRRQLHEIFPKDLGIPNITTI